MRTQAWLPAILLLIAPSSSFAVDVHCSTTACLINTLALANLTPASDTITLDAGRTYQLESTHNSVLQPVGLPTITTPIVIRGNGAILRRNPLLACDPITERQSSFSLLAVAQGGHLIVEKLTLRFGCGIQGGAIHNRGRLELYNVDVVSNVSHGGAGVYSSNGVLIARSSLFQNNATLADAERGGGLLLVGSEAQMNLCEVSFNQAEQGGGIAMNGATLTFNGAIRSNRAVQSGGIQTFGGSLTLDGARILGNRSDMDGGGILADRTRLEISNTRIQDNFTASDGGGLVIYSIDRGGAWSTIRSSSIVRNRAEGNGGGMALHGGEGGLDGLLVIVNSTFAQNSAAASGGGLHTTNGANAFLFHSTFALNIAPFGGSIANLRSPFPTTSPTARIEVAGSIFGVHGPVCHAGPGAAPPLSSGYNIGEDRTCNLIHPRDRMGVVAGLLPPVDTGAPNGWHFPLGISSIARDAGNFTACGGMPELRFDQLGGLRSDLMCDIGAIEFKPPPIF
jgi:hypothetical protein